MIEVDQGKEQPTYATGNYGDFFNNRSTSTFQSTAKKRSRSKTASITKQTNAGVGAEKITWTIGDEASHKKWGIGRIVQIKGEKDDLQLSIAFPDEGIKHLLASFAPIEKVTKEE